MIKILHYLILILGFLGLFFIWLQMFHTSWRNLIGVSVLFLGLASALELVNPLIGLSKETYQSFIMMSLGILFLFCLEQATGKTHINLRKLPVLLFLLGHWLSRYSHAYQAILAIFIFILFMFNFSFRHTQRLIFRQNVFALLFLGSSFALKSFPVLQILLLSISSYFYLQICYSCLLSSLIRSKLISPTQREGHP